MTDDRREAHNDVEPRDGIWPGEAEWLRWEPPFDPSEDFAERVLAGVRAARGPTADASQDTTRPAPESTDLPRPVLDAFDVPEPSTDFVQRTLAAIRADSRGEAPEGVSEGAFDAAPHKGDREFSTGRVADRSDRHAGPTQAGPTQAGSTQAGPALDGHLDAYGVPAPTADFVARTLAAIRADREADATQGTDAASATTGPKLVAERRSATTGPRPSARASTRYGWLAAAATLLIGLGLAWYFGQGSGGTDTQNGAQVPAQLVVRDPAPAASEHSPTLTAVAMARVLDPRDTVAAAPDPLLLLAQGEFGR